MMSSYVPSGCSPANSVATTPSKKRRLSTDGNQAATKAVDSSAVDPSDDVASWLDPTEVAAEANHDSRTYADTKCDECLSHAAGKVFTRCVQYFESGVVHNTPKRDLEDRIRTISKRIHLGNADMQHFEDAAFEALKDIPAYLPSEWSETRKLRESQEAADNGRALVQKAWETHIAKVTKARLAVSKLNDALARVHTMMWYSPRDGRYNCEFMPIPSVIGACDDLVKGVLADTDRFMRDTYFRRPAIHTAVQDEHLTVFLV